ncbi:malto-oligosyltrehalose synthase [Propionivibrio sp.]|uniref:malto-oligosyltrehalose synthase n=1 Tax=Propionivibrio sp. TaxID=2212460 RepID=UPI0039E725BA
MSGDAIALVVEGGDAGSLSLAVDLPAPWSGRTLRWRLWLENGVQRRGLATARPASPGPEDGGAVDGRVPMSLALGEPVPHGRHRLSLAPQAGAAGDALDIDLYVCPPACFDAEAASGGERLWGPSVPVYALRSSRDWGLGDFGDLRRLIDLAADAGAHFVAVEPLHALFPHDPERADPGLPSSREWLNVLYLDVGSMRDFSECREARERVAGEEFRARLAALRGSRSIDYAGVAAAKFELFELLYRHFRLYHLDRLTQRAGLFRDFQREGGRALRLHAVFEALQERFHRLDPVVQGWTAWPAVFRDAQGAAVRAFAAENEARVEYYEYLQWQAEGQLQAVAQRACARGMRVGLCRALAAGAHPGGSEAWLRWALDAGTPPEGAAAGDGQGGLPPPAPQRPCDGGFEPFLAALRANMRQAGALRLDQAAGLARLLPAPRRTAPPLRELFLLLCLESRRRRCVVIGADPAEVPAEVAAAMARHGVLACRTRRAGDEDTAAWPRLALAAVPGDAALAADAAAAACRAVARSPALLAVVPLASVAGRADADAPAGEAVEPSWRRKLAPGMSTDPRWHAAAALLAAERPCPALPVRGSGAFESERADVPRATYRLQFNRDFGFRAAQEILPYLAELGISHIYAAPFLKARPGSAHGYDIVDHGSVNPEIGSMDDFRRYCARLGELGLGQVLDVVPNHVGVLGADNEWWLDVLENGRASAHARHFDIDWSPPSAELRGKVLLPVLGDQYGAVLENGELVLGFSPERGEFSVHYHEHRFPIDPCDYPWILVGDEAAATGVPDGFFEEPATATLLAALRTLPARDGDGEAAHLERRRNQPIFKQQLAALYARLPAVREHVAARLGALNGTPGDPASFDGLDRLLERQAYRLASWRVAADDINYRRFFDVNDLAALRIEDDEVFAATHARIFGWIAEGCVSGLRVDHPDGLSDPAAYFRRLQDTYARLGAGVEGKTLYVVVEKIVGEFESLPQEWPVHGETGYRFSAFCNSLFVDAAQESRFSRVYRAFSGEMRDFSEVLLESRYLIMAHSLPGEVSGLASLLHAIAQQDRGTRDFTRSRLRGALLEIAAGFPVYRTYIGPRGVSAADRRHVERAVDDAARRGLAGDASALHFVRDVILSAPTEPAPPLRRLKLAFVRRFQQFTAPVMAKAMEDTAFYRYNRLLSLNEVGSDPRTFGSEPNDFHAACERLSCDHPFGLLGSFDARQQAVGGRAGAPRRAVRNARRLAAGAAPLGPPQRPQQDARRRRPGAVGQRRIPALPDAARHLAVRTGRRRGDRGAGRARRGLPAEGRARSQAAHQLDESGRGLRGGAVRLRAGNPGPRHAAGHLPRRFPAVPGHHRALRRVQQPEPAAAQADRAGRARRLPGLRALEPQSGRPRQPAAGRLRHGAGAAARAAARVRARPRRGGPGPAGARPGRRAPQALPALAGAAGPARAARPVPPRPLHPARRGRPGGAPRGGLRARRRAAGGHRRRHAPAVHPHRRRSGAGHRQRALGGHRRRRAGAVRPRLAGRLFWAAGGRRHGGRPPAYRSGGAVRRAAAAAGAAAARRRRGGRLSDPGSRHGACRERIPILPTSQP